MPHFPTAAGTRALVMAALLVTPALAWAQAEMAPAPMPMPPSARDGSSDKAKTKPASRRKAAPRAAGEEAPPAERRLSRPKAAATPTMRNPDIETRRAPVSQSLQLEDDPRGPAPLMMPSGRPGVGMRF